MNASEMEAAGINLSLVAWLARHASDIPALVSGIQSVIGATTLDARWTALKRVGDLIVADLGDFPGFAPAPSPAPVEPPGPEPSPIGPVAACTAADADAALAAVGDRTIINAIISIVTNPEFLSLLVTLLRLLGVAV